VKAQRLTWMLQLELFWAITAKGGRQTKGIVDTRKDEREGTGKKQILTHH